MSVWINGERRELAEPARRVVDVLARAGRAETGVAVAVDGEVVPRADWAAHRARRRRARRGADRGAGRMSVRRRAATTSW